MSNIQHRESDALLVALTPVIQEFVDAAAQSAGDFHTVECAGASAFRKLRVMLMTTGIKVSAQCAERNYHCPECAVP